MPAYKTIAILIDYALALALVFVVYRALRDSLRETLDQVIRLSAATTFYLRVLSLTLVLLALSKVIGSRFDLKPEARFMEYVWGVAGDLGGMFENVAWNLLAYLTLITILVAVLRYKNGK